MAAREMIKVLSDPNYGVQRDPDFELLRFPAGFAALLHYFGVDQISESARAVAGKFYRRLQIVRPNRLMVALHVKSALRSTREVDVHCIRLWEHVCDADIDDFVTVAYPIFKMLQRGRHLWAKAIVHPRRIAPTPGAGK